MDFVNRQTELSILNNFYQTGQLAAIYGRRRVGKTRLILQWLQSHQGYYSQVIEGHPTLQFDQFYQDIASGLGTDIIPKTWEELFTLINLETKPFLLCIDEFPYLIASDPSLPSRFQKWLDHTPKKNLRVILSGSSMHMMHDAFLNANSPLYGRAHCLLHIKPMSYQHFCDALHLDSTHKKTFILYSMVGGIPRYWELLKGHKDPIAAADALYFSEGAIMEFEPIRILTDEKIEGVNPLTLLELIGRGVHRLSELAGRLNQPATNFGRVLRLLLDSSLVVRETPFGDNVRNTKKVIYQIDDAALLFWFQIFSPHRSRWHNYSPDIKEKLLSDHASMIYENWIRNHEGAHRYWDKHTEFDSVRWDEENNKLLIKEIKFSNLTSPQKQQLCQNLERKFITSPLAAQYPNASFEVLDLDYLKQFK